MTTPAAPRLARLAIAALVIVATAAPAALAADPLMLYPCQVRTRQGRVYNLESLGHSLEQGAFTFYDGDVQGRVSWRDLDGVRFINNIKGIPGANAQRIPKTERVELLYLDGSVRQVNLIIGRVHGYDGIAERNVDGTDLILLDLDEARIAPTLYKTCERGHTWEQDDYRHCPYDGLPLTETPLR